MDEQVDISFIFCIQLYIIHVEKMADGNPALEFVSICVAGDYMVEGI